MWYIVLFPHENTVSIIPSSWYVETSEECFWPPRNMKRLDIDKFIKEKYLPEASWKPYKAKIMGQYGDYKEARIKLAKAKERDHLSSTDNETTGRGKRIKIAKRYSSSASEADASASEDGLSYPSFSNLYSEKDDGCSSPKIHSVVQCSSNNSTINFQQKRSILPNTIERKRKLFCRTKSRSLSPKILVNEKGSQLDQRYSEFKPRNNQQQLATAPSFLSLEELYQNRSPVQSNLVSKNQNEDHITAQSNSSETTTSNILPILQKMQSDEAEFRVQVIRKLNIINMKLNDIEENIQTISINKENVQPEGNPDNDEMHNLFPLDYEKLNSLEKLLENGLYKRKLIKHLSYVGGADVAEVCKRLMYKLFTNETGQRFSWDGAKGKMQFKNLKIADVIFGTVRANRNTKECTNLDVIIQIKKWLVRSKERIKITNRNREIQNNEGHNEVLRDVEAE